MFSNSPEKRPKNETKQGSRRKAIVLYFLVFFVVSYSLSSSAYKSSELSFLYYGTDLHSNRESSAASKTDAVAGGASGPKAETTLSHQLAALDGQSPPDCPKGLVRITDVHNPAVFNNTKRKIPKIMFQTSRSRCITPRLYELTEKWRFEGWSYHFFDDDAMVRLLHDEFDEFPHLKLLTKRCIEYGTIRADLWRYLVLWKYGGVYADLDSIPGSNFTDATIADQDDSFFVVEHYHLLSQYFLAASPRHPLMFYALHKSLESLLTASDTGQFNAALKTGPHALHKGFQLFMHDAGVKVDNPPDEPIKAGLYTGTNNRTVRVIGYGGKQSNEFVVREAVSRGPKIADYKIMNMTHNQEDKNNPTNRSCIQSFLLGD